MVSMTVAANTFFLLFFQRQSIHEIEIEIVSETNEMLCVHAYGKNEERNAQTPTDRRTNERSGGRIV